MTLLGAPSASADGGQLLMPDPDAYCVNNAPYQTQVNEAGWTVQYLGLQGDASQNDWACQYAVAATIPTTFDGGDSFTLPPQTQTFPIDWAVMCEEQYDGSTPQWVGVPGPAASPGPFGAPWMCLGAPGAQYDQTETASGPVGRIGVRYGAHHLRAFRVRDQRVGAEDPQPSLLSTFNVAGPSD
jgi:hypothetical protein